MNNRFIEPVLTELSEPTNFFFEQTPELDAATGVIGHLRIDFGRNGKQFLHTWKQRGKAELNTPISEYLCQSGQYDKGQRWKDHRRNESESH